MNQIGPEDFEAKVDSLYRLVLIAARRAAQMNRMESRPLVPVRSKKPTVAALEEIAQGKVTYRIASEDEEGILE